MNVKSLKKLFITVAVMSIVFVLAGCGLFGSDPTDCVQKMLDAYTSADVKEFASYFEEDDRMHYLMKAVDGSGAGEMQEIYAKVYELTQNAEITVVGQGTDKDRVKVKIKTVDYSDAFYNSMITAMKESGTKFMDAPGWMQDALSKPGKTVERELEVHVKPNGKMYDANYNAEFFDVLTGGFYDYIGCTMAGCVADSSKVYMLGNADKVIYSLDEYRETISGSGMTAGNVNGVITHYKAKYAGLAGVEAGGVYTEPVVRLYVLVDYKLATTNSLEKMGIVAGSATGDVSLSASVKGLQASGYNCEVTDFGVGVESEEDK
ncbi:MAG: DUF1307 domain-containing protein [Lachnospiraceae bacterium]|nr:DUF1307 domain-containing protein [Lachnospiraceae bacterium]